MQKGKRAVLVVGCALSSFGCSGGELNQPPSGENAVKVEQGLGPALGVHPLQPNVTAGGRTLSVGFSATVPDLAFAAAESGGLFKTTNSGIHWDHVDSLVPFRMSDVKISPSQPDTVIATVRNDSRTVPLTGIWRSTDGGATWQHPPSSIPANCSAGSGRAIAFSPDSNHVYVGTDCSIAVSSDQGATWTQVVPSTAAGQVLAVTAQPGGIVDIMAQDGFHRSLDHGATWSGTGTGMGGGIDQHTIGASPIEAGVLIAVGGSTTQRWDVYESDDGGATWTSLSAPVDTNGRPPLISTHLAGDNDPTHFDVYYHDSVSVFKQTCTSGVAGLRCSTTWNTVALQHTDCDEIGYSSGSNCPTLLVGDGGIQTTTDCGSSFHFTGGGLGGYNALQLFSVVDQVHPASTDIYFTTQDNGTYASGDNGMTWPGIVGGDGCGIDMLHNTASNAGQVVTGATCFGSIFKDVAILANGGSVPWPSPTGTPSSNPFIVDTATFVQFAQTPPSTANDLYFTTDTGGTWTRVANATIANGLGGAVNVDERLRIAGSTANPTVYVPFRRANGTVGLERLDGVLTGTATVASADNGLGSIAQFIPGEEGQSDPAVWNVDPNNPARLMAVDISGAGSIKTTSNSGATWTTDAQLTSLVRVNGEFQFSAPNFGSETHAIAFDPANGQRILVGTDSAGLFASFNNGASWIGVPGSRAITGITDIAFDEIRSDVYVSTYGRGLWRLGWCSNTGGPDTTPPSFSFVPPDIVTSNCGTVDIGQARAVDVCSNSAVTITNNAPTKFAPGTTIVTWTARDASGNTTTATQRVTLILRDDPACCPAGTNVIIGTSNNDTLNGTSGSDCILGGKGAQDIINGNGGNDFISGGDGDDIINGGPGNDVVFGGSGQDNITDTSGDDQIFGDDGDDTIHGGVGNDVVRGGQGNDQLFGDDDNDQLFGDDGFDTLQGGNGNDDLVGGAAVNTCSDSSGTNTFTQCKAPSPDSCLDGAKDGTETDLDCGRSCSTHCSTGKACVSGNDCASGLCGAGTCQPSDGIGTNVSGLLQASLQVTTDFGSGYCVALSVINNALIPTTNFSVNVNIPQASTYSTWNGTFSGTTGPVTIAPTLAASKALASGATDSSSGFCANRVAGTHALPSVVSATPTFF